jgi:CRISPR type III-A-associated protein Csm2
MTDRRDRNRGGFNNPFRDHFQDRFPNQGHGSGDSQKREKSLEDVWKDYLKNGYFDENGNLREELVKRENLQNLAKEMANAKPKPLSSNQLRRFFQHCRVIESRILSKNSSWEREKTEFMKLDVAAADAYGKQEKKIPKIFHDFIEQNVAAVKTEKDFMCGFIKHFEALVGFASRYLDKERR